VGLGERAASGSLVICSRSAAGTVLDPRMGRVWGVDAAPKMRRLRVDWSVRYMSVISVRAGDWGVNS